MLLQYRDAGAAENTRHRRDEAADGLGLELGEKNRVGRELASQQTLAAAPNGGVMVKCLNTYAWVSPRCQPGAMQGCTWRNPAGRAPA